MRAEKPRFVAEPLDIAPSWEMQGHSSDSDPFPCPVVSRGYGDTDQVGPWPEVGTIDQKRLPGRSTINVPDSLLTALWLRRGELERAMASVGERCIPPFSDWARVTVELDGAGVEFVERRVDDDWVLAREVLPDCWLFVQGHRYERANLRLKTVS